MKQSTVLHPAGYIVVDGKEVAKTLMCVHCGRHAQEHEFKGFCYNCCGPICGKRCAQCVPLEKALGLKEGTTDPNRVQVNVPKLWTGD